MSSVRSKLSLTCVALCLSLIAHACLLGATVRAYVNSLGQISLPGFARRLVQQDDASIFESRLGEQNAIGDAIDSSPGDEALEARQADQNQAFLSRDPPGRPNAMPQPAAAKAPPSEDTEESREVREIPFGVSGITPQAPSPAKHAAPTPQVARAAAPAGIPAVQAKTESVPVSREGHAEFRAGKLNVQLGRPHRIITPRLGLAGIVDAGELGGVELVLSLTLDTDGNVRQVSIARSSGSENIDQVWRVAAYQWWFEPPRNEFGKPQPDTLRFAIRFL